MIRVYLAERDPVIRHGLCRQIAAEPDLVLSGSGDIRDLGPDAVAGVDVLATDVRLTDTAGVLSCRRLRTARPGLRVLLRTAYEDGEAVLAVLVTGASGYVLEQIRGDALVRAIRDVAAGSAALDPLITASVLRRLNVISGPDVLSAAETGLLELAARGMTDAQIARRLHARVDDVAERYAAIATRLVAGRYHADGATAAERPREKSMAAG